MSRYIDPVTQYFLNNGDVAVAGLLYFYENLDYLTPKNTFNDAGAINTNPVVLDGSGRIPEINGSGLYSIVYKSSAGVTQWTRDNYDMTTGGGSSSSLVSPTVTGDINFLTAGAKIKGDFSSATASLRNSIQTRTPNSQTIVDIAPSGSGTLPRLNLKNSSDVDNSGFLSLRIAGTISAIIEIGKVGTGAAPIALFIQIPTEGQIWKWDSGGNYVPVIDNSYNIGESGGRVANIWAANGTIQTSDLRTKTEVFPSSLGLNFINALEPISYKFIVGGNDVVVGSDPENPTVTPRPGTRTHWGFPAQHVKQVADEFGVDFGGHILTDINDPDSEQGLRYVEFIAPMVKAIQELTARVEELEAILNP